MKMQLALRALAVAREPVRLSLEGGAVSYDGVIERVGADFLELRLLNGGQYPRIYERGSYARESREARAPGVGVRIIPLARLSAVIARISR
ncbi:hypothetical protein [Rothia mucilaginosa]|uniref:hypothetical protein n=1 Tax=Rothia mucilaginosa TaxID=43675 RepID=UPI0026EEF626|nr:hypothetical protein [Rothia mucilaginosa]